MDRQEGARDTFGPNVGGLHYASKGPDFCILGKSEAWFRGGERVNNWSRCGRGSEYDEHRPHLTAKGRRQPPCKTPNAIRCSCRQHELV